MTEWCFQGFRLGFVGILTVFIGSQSAPADNSKMFNYGADSGSYQGANSGSQGFNESEEFNFSEDLNGVLEPAEQFDGEQVRVFFEEVCDPDIQIFALSGSVIEKSTGRVITNFDESSVSSQAKVYGALGDYQNICDESTRGSTVIYKFRLYSNIFYGSGVSDLSLLKAEVNLIATPISDFEEVVDETTLTANGRGFLSTNVGNAIGSDSALINQNSANLNQGFNAGGGCSISETHSSKTMWNLVLYLLTFAVFSLGLFWVKRSERKKSTRPILS